MGRSASCGSRRRRDAASRASCMSSKRLLPDGMQSAGSVFGFARQGVSLAASARIAAWLFWPSGRGRSGHATGESPYHACRTRPGTQSSAAAVSAGAARNTVEGADPLAQMDRQIRRRRTLEAIKRIILRESLEHALVVIFEDLHWVDSETQALLDLLADSDGHCANAAACQLPS